MEIVPSELPIGGRRFAGTCHLEVEGPGDGDEVRSPHPAAFGLWAIRDSGQVEIQGWVATTVVARCVRCLESFSSRLERQVDVSYASADREPQEDVGQLDESDLHLDYYRGDTVDLRTLLAEQLVLALPMKLVCDEDCLGLCPQCGADNNKEDCDCGPVVDPRLASLAEIRERL